MDPRNRGWRRAFALSAVLLAATSARLTAATLEVNAGGGTPFQTIQSAIDAALPGVDDVFVHCGVYHENILMRDGVSVTGERADCAVIDGGQNGSTVTIIDVGSPTVLEGFTIRNGRSALGGGIYLEASSSTITGNVITGNSAIFTVSWTGTGGGIHVTSPVSLLRRATAPVISANIIWGNSAETWGGGIEIYGDEGSTIVNNLIGGNAAADGGGGIDVFDSYPTIVNNTIVENCLQGGGTACEEGGGGIALTLSGIVEIANNVIVGNEAEQGGGGVDLATSDASFWSNDVFGNQPANYSGVADPTGSSGNISLDPLFVTTWPNRASYEPRSDSPLVDAGVSGPAPVDDLRRIPRPMDGDGNGAPRYDIGARENEGITRLSFDGDDGLTWDPSIDGLALFNVYRGDLQVLRDTGVYTQDPVTVPGAQRWCGLLSPAVTDTYEPDPGQVLFYLAVLSHMIEGSLGFDSTPWERPYNDGNRCP
jgi:putative cofactor-binding repeat protein